MQCESWADDGRGEMYGVRSIDWELIDDNDDGKHEVIDDCKTGPVAEGYLIPTTHSAGPGREV